MNKPTNKRKAPLKKTESVAHYESVLLEGMRDDIRAIADGLVMTREELGGRIEASRTELKQEIADVKTGLGMLHARVDRVESGLNDKIDHVEKELKDTRNELSGKIDKIGDRLDRHDAEITQIKQASL